MIQNFSCVSKSTKSVKQWSFKGINGKKHRCSSSHVLHTSLTSNYCYHFKIKLGKSSACVRCYLTLQICQHQLYQILLWILDEFLMSTILIQLSLIKTAGYRGSSHGFKIQSLYTRRCGSKAGLHSLSGSSGHSEDWWRQLVAPRCNTWHWTPNYIHMSPGTDTGFVPNFSPYVKVCLTGPGHDLLTWPEKTNNMIK